MRIGRLRLLNPRKRYHLKTTVEINSDLLMNQEYSLQITLETNKGEGYYYTRIVSRSNVNADQSH